MIARLGKKLARLAARYVPDPFVLALLLSIVAGLAAWLSVRKTENAPVSFLFESWTRGALGTGGLAFALSMCLILVTGHAMATSPPARRFVRWLSILPRSSQGAVVIVTLFSCVASLLHWGLGVIAGALLAREIARVFRESGKPVNYPLLGAAAYTGFAVWHGGLSGSAPLEIAKQDHLSKEIVSAIPMADTVFSSTNLLVTGGLIVALVLIMRALAKTDDSNSRADSGEDSSSSPITLGGPPPTTAPANVETKAATHQAENHPHDELGKLAGYGTTAQTPPHPLLKTIHHSPWIGRAIGTAGLGLLVTSSLDLNLTSVTLGFLFLSLAMQGSLRAFTTAISKGAGNAGAIILQFPFYFGIIGMLKESGLAASIASGLVNNATETTLPILTFLGAGLLNFFVPSGGGQWVIQGPIALGAAQELGVDPATIVLAFSYGDAWTNLLQPFWALPLLGIMGLKAKDIVGYTAIAFLAMGLLVPTLLFIVE